VSLGLGLLSLGLGLGLLSLGLGLGLLSLYLGLGLLSLYLGLDVRCGISRPASIGNEHVERVTSRETVADGLGSTQSEPPGFKRPPGVGVRSARAGPRTGSRVVLRTID
jgi:hypothetical protein